MTLHLLFAFYVCSPFGPFSPILFWKIQIFFLKNTYLSVLIVSIFLDFFLTYSQPVRPKKEKEKKRKKTIEDKEKEHFNFQDLQN